MRHSSVNFQVFTALLDSSAPDGIFDPGQNRRPLLPASSFDYAPVFLRPN